MPQILHSASFNPYEKYRFRCPNFYYVYITCIKCKCERCEYFKSLVNTHPFPRIECWRKNENKIK